MVYLPNVFSFIPEPVAPIVPSHSLEELTFDVVKKVIGRTSGQVERCPANLLGGT